MMDALSVVSQLRDLASEPQNREAIVQDQGCLPGLVLFLDHRSPEVLLATLQTLRYLAELSLNISTMKNELGMMVSLENIVARDELSVDVTDLAKEVYAILSASPERNGRQKPQFFLNSSSKKAKCVTLHIQGLDDTDRRGLCEEALLKVRGVISFTFQMASKRCTVRVRSDLPAESLASAIADTRVLCAKQVVKNHEGDEVLIPLSAAAQSERALPDYLPEEDDEPEKKAAGAVSRPAAATARGGTWLHAAAGFLSRTFYW
ncbi:armadillo repeat containing 1, like [Corythoichthys intestinalis]|uniref:armadillo repeat containing 1, like n=1 Tax=Corythoichthys intestinalis TaxID=161448 RepID=UPI0025A64D30|nr:armadillo repeat containing 1, like [Corythoichthys intestinalis]XP_057678348.1 armadillo repeat containing 1, like [Corythoichthys intestinalis]XP_061806865.1 armadillo repeat-containing protein 1-like [Nerophis lumbriciformis]